MWMPRLSVFNYDKNKYYVPNGQFNTSSRTASIQMPNCTQYCFLRMHESTAQDCRQAYWIRSTGGFGDAKTWYSTTTLPKGTELREGAIAVFDGNCGHVVYIEKKLSSTRAIYTQSSYNDNKNLRDWQFWSKREADFIVGKATISGVGKLIGFIYPPIDDIRVARNTLVNQVEIKEDMVNVRIDPSTFAANYDGCYCAPGIYNIIDTRECDGYTWVELEHDHWVACGSWAVIYEAEEQCDDSTSELKAQIKELKAENKELTATNKSLSSELEANKKDLTSKNNLIDSIRIQINNINNLLNK